MEDAASVTPSRVEPLEHRKEKEQVSLNEDQFQQQVNSICNYQNYQLYKLHYLTLLYSEQPCHFHPQNQPLHFLLESDYEWFHGSIAKSQLRAPQPN